MKLLLSTFLLLFSIQLVAQSTPATKDDLRQMEARINSNFEILINQTDKRFEMMQTQMDKRFEQVDKRFEDMNKRFEDMNSRFEMMNMYLLAIVGAIGILFLRGESNTKMLLREISKHKAETKPLDEQQLIYILSNSNRETKLRIRELLQIS